MLVFRGVNLYHHFIWTLFVGGQKNKFTTANMTSKAGEPLTAQGAWPWHYSPSSCWHRWVSSIQHVENSKKAVPNLPVLTTKNGLFCVLPCDFCGCWTRTQIFVAPILEASFSCNKTGRGSKMLSWKVGGKWRRNLLWPWRLRPFFAHGAVGKSCTILVHIAHSYHY